MDGGGRFLFALTEKLKAYIGYAPRAYGDDSPRVLPRLVRKPVRFFSRLLQGDITIPRHAEGVGIASIFGVSILYGSIVGGQFGAAVEGVTATIGFAVSEIEIAGNTHTSPKEVFAALGLDGKRSLISIDAVEAQFALQQLPWVQGARIAKVYPDKLEIDVEERDAFALWQQGTALTVVQKDGAVIGGYAGDSRLAALPLLVGKGATDEGADFIQVVASFADIAPRVRAYIRVGTRRWNLRLDNGVTVQLPEQRVEHALGRLTALQAELGVMDRDLSGIDLRIEDRTVFAMTDNARKTRDAFVKARSEAAKKIRKARGSRI